VTENNCYAEQAVLRRGSTACEVTNVAWFTVVRC